MVEAQTHFEDIRAATGGAGFWGAQSLRQLAKIASLRGQEDEREALEAQAKQMLRLHRHGRSRSAG